MTEAETTVRREREPTVETRWVRSAVAGFVAGIAFGLYLQFAGVLPSAGGASGLRAVVIDWTVHLFHALVFAVAYAELVSWSRLTRHADRLPTGALLGAGYGVVLWVVAVGVVVAFWTLANTVWILPVPRLTVASLAGHVLYGVVLGAAFALLRRT